VSFIKDLFEEFITFALPEGLLKNFYMQKMQIAADKQRDDMDRFNAIMILKNSECVPLLESIALDRSNGWIPRTGAIRGLRRHRESKNRPDGIDVVCQRVCESVIQERGADSDMRKAAVWAMDVNSYDEIKTIIQVALDKTVTSNYNKEVRWAAIKQLPSTENSYYYNRAIICLVKIAEDTEDDYVSRINAIRKLDKTKHRDLLWELKKDPDNNVKSTAIEILHA